MDQSQLDGAVKILEDVLKSDGKVTTANYAAPQNLKKEALDPDRQRLRHRNILLWLVIALSGLSFIFLAAIISFQMWKRVEYPDYTGASDVVINIMAVSVFAQVIAVVATIAKLVFQDKR
jgi:uncharacterized membrane protein YcjF (UPF0283 family)